MSSKALWGLCAAIAAAVSMSFVPVATAACPEGGCPGDPGGGITLVTLTVAVSGPGSVKSGATTICTNATTPCTLRYEQGQDVTLSAAPGSGDSFGGWSGACSGALGCSVTMSGDRTVGASFHAIPPTITSPAQNAPPPTTPAQSVSFAGAAGTASFRCRMDDPTFSSATTCASPWSTGLLSTGTHTVYVWALDASGNVSVFAARSFKIVVRPDTTIGGTPANGAVTNDPATAFTYSSATGTSYSCHLDGAPVACSSDLAPADGAHTLTAAAGVLFEGVTYYDISPATRSWTVDTQAPDTTITDAPSGFATLNDATVAFSGTDPAPGTALTFACSLDGDAAAPCSSGVAYHDLAPGPHTFSVVATDAAGNVDGTPATRSWTVLADADGDGFFTNVDCDDASAAVHPGAAEVPGNAIDENCDGTAQPATAPPGPGGPAPGGSTPGGTVPSVSLAPPAIAAHLSVKWHRVGRTTRVRRFTITRVPAGAKVRVACSGKGCPFKHRTFTARRGKVSLTRALRRTRLRGHARLTLTISAPGHRAQVVRYTARPPRSPLRR